LPFAAFALSGFGFGCSMALAGEAEAGTLESDPPGIASWRLIQTMSQGTVRLGRALVVWKDFPMPR
jgi:hypothetical protein